MTVVVLWSTLFSLNRGVNALSRSTIDILKNLYPDKNIILIGTGYFNPILYEGVSFYNMPDIKGLIKLFLKVNIIGTKAIAMHYNNQSFLNTSLVLDLSEGDGFTDIYGNWRFLSMILSKFIFLKLSRRYVLLPQTIGPFNNWLFNKLAAKILKRCERIFTRDLESKIYTQKITGRECIFCHDLAFTLIPIPIKSFSNVSSWDIGINVSGLLWRGGYTSNNQFNLKVNYQNLLIEIVKFFINKGCNIILIPHTYGDTIEDDLIACQKLKAILNEKGYSVDIVLDNYSERELKWIISHLDFFIGSRMHSCIAALSTGVPAIGIAYSQKFKGVYASIGIEELVLDARMLEISEMMEQINRIYLNRLWYQDRLNNEMPLIITGIQKTMKSIICG